MTNTPSLTILIPCSFWTILPSASNTIYHDTVIMHVEENDRIIAFCIKNAKYTQVQREHFEAVWKRAKK